MKYTNLRAFEKHLAEAAPNHFSSLYMLVDKDSFSRKSVAGKLLSSLLSSQKYPEHGQRLFNADENTVDEIVQELNSPGFFSEQRVILVNNAEKLTKGAVEKLEPYFTQPSLSTYLVLSCNSLSSATTFYKKVEKAGIILEIPEEKPWEKEKSMQAWAREQTALQNKQMDLQASQFLIKQIGTDTSLLQQELDKLVIYVGDKISIDMHDVAAICVSIPLETVWQLGEAIFKREAASALRISKALLEEGTPFLSLLRQIRNQFQTELEIGYILARGGSAEDVSKQFAYMKGTILTRHMQMAQSYGVKKLKEGLLLIDAAELKVKNSLADPNMLNELLIVKLC